MSYGSICRVPPGSRTVPVAAGTDSTRRDWAVKPFPWNIHLDAGGGQRPIHLGRPQ